MLYTSVMWTQVIEKVEVSLYRYDTDTVLAKANLAIGNPDTIGSLWKSWNPTVRYPLAEIEFTKNYPKLTIYQT
jgi:hypothetical protein